ncbi:hypothetical protein QYF36_026425 [Acer negundo]|nr:hypothetical protein QYF36_026425 [Acer negundo]
MKIINLDHILNILDVTNITESITILIYDGRYQIKFESNYGNPKRFPWRNCNEVEFRNVVMERWNTLARVSINAGDFLAIIEYFLGQDLPNPRIVFKENALEASVSFSNDEMLPLTWSGIESFPDFLDITLNIGFLPDFINSFKILVLDVDEIETVSVIFTLDNVPKELSSWQALWMLQFLFLTMKYYLSLGPGLKAFREFVNERRRPREEDE